MVGLCSRKVGPRVEGVAGVGAAFSQQGGLRGPQEVWRHGVSAMSYVPFTALGVLLPLFHGRGN